MNRTEFCSLTPDQFRAVWDAYAQKEQRTMRTQWEVARFASYCALQPHSKKKLKPTDIITFEWDVEKPKQVEKSTREDFERAVARYNHKKEE